MRPGRLPETDPLEMIARAQLREQLSPEAEAARTEEPRKPEEAKPLPARWGSE